jgi:hypothetical protein
MTKIKDLYGTAQESAEKVRKADPSGQKPLVMTRIRGLDAPLKRALPRSEHSQEFFSGV